MNNKFKNRWRIEGTLTTNSPLHIGSGSTTTRKEIKNEETEIAAVITDCKNKPYLPGTTLKGNLRACLEKTKQDKKIIEKLLGYLDPKAKESCGGAAEFWNARAKEPSAFDSQYIPYWEKDRLTGVAASAVIDRQTRTAANKKLFYIEYVPPGITFDVVITGQDLDADEVAVLLFALNGFNIKNVKLGAAETDGWGEFEWKLDSVTCIDFKHAKEWIISPENFVGYNMKGLDKTDEFKKEIANSIQPSPSDLLDLEITLTFNGPFLVNDTSNDRNLKDADGKKKFGDHYPLVNTKGDVILPAKSIRGAFRSQAERILRTLGGGQTACFDHDKAERQSCASVFNKNDVENSCPACQVFGLSGWRSPIRFSDFTSNIKMPKRQQFVAIDRFTGGGAEGAKFDADYADRPKLKGSMTIEIGKLQKVNAEDWGLGLIALTLRDFMDGDITFGFGASKGYGACKAEITSGLDELKEKLKDISEWHETLVKYVNAHFSRRTA